jgi:hypothetical protein
LAFIAPYGGAEDPRPCTVAPNACGSFFATLDAFGRVYGTPTPINGIGTSAYTAFTSGHLAQGALLVLQGPRHAVLIVLVGQYVTPHNTITRARTLARRILKTRQLSS